MSDDLRVGLVGYGLAGSTFHAPLIAATPGLRLTTVVTASPQRQADVRTRHTGAAVVPSAAELWARARDHDLVVVAAPNAVHADLARAALAHGLPVVADKPLAVTAAEGRRVVADADARGLLLTVFQNRRWDSDQLTLRRLLAEGEFGPVHRHESRFERWRPEIASTKWRERLPAAQGGGALLDLGSHLVDQAVQLFGPVRTVYAEVAARRGAADDDAFLALTHVGEVRSHLSLGAVAAAPGPRLRVLGARGAYVVDGLDGQEDALRAGRRPDESSPWGVEPPQRWGRLLRGEVAAPVPSERGRWDLFYPALARAVRDGGPPPVDPRDAIGVLEVLEAARTSATEARVVELPG
ncbi:MAG TPA: Gfo/Idh/MocA family oxidoreductase [Mycobacteriales bacterium]|nr:Gfo/Idh/MocA family oxidoreductase [Mycobacteriales bacterium]